MSFIAENSFVSVDLGADILIDFYTVLSPDKIALVSLIKRKCFIVSSEDPTLTHFDLSNQTVNIGAFILKSQFT